MLGVNSPFAEIPAVAPAAGDRRHPAARGPVPAAARPEICPNRCARWARGEGLGAGVTVALLTRDSIRAAPLRLGLDRVGVRVVSLDADLRGAALAAGLIASGATLVIADTALAEAYAGVVGRLEICPAVWWNGPGADFARLDLALAEQDGSPLAAHEMAA